MKAISHQFFLRLSVVVSATLSGCVTLQSCMTTKSPTNITGSWKSPEASSYKNFFVAVLTKNLDARTVLEHDISKKLKREHVKATESLSVFSHTEKVETPDEKKAAVEKIESLGFDAIIVITLIKKTEENRYVRGTNSYAPTNVGVGTGYYNPATGTDLSPGGQYGAFGMYYVGGATAYNTPGYYEVDEIYFVQSNMYDAKTSQLVWSAQSETFYPGNLDAASGYFSRAMVDAIRTGNLIYKKT